MKTDRENHLPKVRKVVIKIGSSLLTDEKKKRIQTRFLGHLAEQVRDLQKRGVQCLIVTSGAIAAGRFELKLDKRPKEIEKLQALAAIGQSKLMHAYEIVFKRVGLKVAQILLTREDLSNRQRYSNAHNTVMELFKNKIIPVVNENDTVAVEEIKFGNNDILGTLVTHLSQSDLLILLTDTDGFFEEDPRLNPDAKIISEVHAIDEHLEKKASRTITSLGTGGMKTKIQAAKVMMQSGIPMIIANGNRRNVLKRLLNSEPIGTFFTPSKNKMSSRKSWLAWSVRPKGEIVIDDGAKIALLEKNKSLLSTGIKRVSGVWNRGEIIKIIGQNGREIAHGLSNYSSRELEQIKGLKSHQIQEQLGGEMVCEAVHRDNLVKL